MPLAAVANEPSSSKVAEVKLAAVIFSGRAADILSESIALFNRYGAQAVSTNKIAAVLEISPGNLHYHFKTKVDILTAAYEQMEAETRAAIDDLSPPMTARQSIAWQKNVLTCLWRYRFFFAGLDFFLQRAPRLLQRFTEFQDWAISRLAALHADRIDEGTMKPVPTPNTLEGLSANLWMLWIAWIRWEMIVLAGGEYSSATDESVVHRLLKHHFSFHSVYYGDRAAERMFELIEKDKL